MRYNGIQVLRGMAALYVFLFHTAGWWMIGKNSFTAYFLSKGASGVDIFFVISGFVIFQNIHTGKKGITDFLVFLKKRLYRIFPPYWIVLIVFTAVGFCSFNAGIVNKLKTIFLVPGGVIECMIPAWTLSYELYFYLLAGLFILHKNFKYLWYAVIAIALFLTINDHFKFTAGALPKKAVVSFFVLEFFLGMLAGYWHKKISYRLSYFFLPAGIIIFFLPFIESDLMRLVYLGFSSFLIVLAITSLEIKFNFTIPRFLILFGNSSYILYLINYGLCHYVLSFYAGTGSLSVFNMLVFISLVIIISMVLHSYVEKPLLKQLKKI